MPSVGGTGQGYTLLGLCSLKENCWGSDTRSSRTCHPPKTPGLTGREGRAHSPRRALDRVRARLSSVSKLICKQHNGHVNGNVKGFAGTSSHFLAQALLVTENDEDRDHRAGET